MTILLDEPIICRAKVIRVGWEGYVFLKNVDWNIRHPENPRDCAETEKLLKKSSNYNGRKNWSTDILPGTFVSWEIEEQKEHLLEDAGISFEWVDAEWIEI